LATLFLSEAQRSLTLQRLEDAKLLTVQRDEPTGVLVAVDAHPLLREYFARQLREKNPEAWRAAHRRLYEHLCATAPECTKFERPDLSSAFSSHLSFIVSADEDASQPRQPTLDDFQPLYQAIAHGCQAGLQQKACDEVYYGRILREGEFYSTRKLGAFSSDLGAVACFFDAPWSLVSPSLNEESQRLMLAVAGFALGALGRLTEALEPIWTGLERGMQREDCGEVALRASNLSELELTLGKVADSVKHAEQSLSYADRSQNPFWKMDARAKIGNALHQAGRWNDAVEQFRTAEKIYRNDISSYHVRLASPNDFFCDDVFLAPLERASWRLILGGAAKTTEKLLEPWRTASQRLAQVVEWRNSSAGTDRQLLDIALEHLSLGRFTLYATILGGAGKVSLGPNLTPAQAIDKIWANTCRELDAAVDALRRANTLEFMVRGLLSRAWMRFLDGKLTGPESAQEDLNEAWEIAERGPMRLFLADIHLYRAGLFSRGATYPWKSPTADLAAARKLIEQCSYGRRKEELEDAEAALRQPYS
jgi:tetratricopeptide (TPR) repeat protein